MKTIYSLVLLAVPLTICISVFGQVVAPPARDAAKEEVIYNDLRKIAPKQVDTFREATEALDSERYVDAITKYGTVLSEAPNFQPAMRRLGYAKIAVGSRDEGLKLLEKALSMDRSVDNLSGLASALLATSDPNARPSDADIKRSYALIKEASEKPTGDDLDVLSLKASLAMDAKDDPGFFSTVDRLVAKYPNEAVTAYFNSISLATKGDFDRGLTELDRSVQLGVDPVYAADIRGQMEKARDEAYPFRKYLVYLYIFLVLTAVWAIGLLGLYFLGRRLSAKTLSAIESSDPTDVTGVGHTGLRTAYRRLVSFASAYYYVSQPMVVLLVIAVTGGVIFTFFMIGRLPIAFLLGLVFVGGGSIFYMFKSILIRPKVEDPGRLLERHEAPELWDLVKKVAVDINTRPVDEIRVTPGVDIAVYERGGFREKMKDKGTRVLILGVGTFNGFSANAFRAVLAHEYGHLSNRDTAGGDVAFRVNTDMMRLAEAMVNSGTNTYHNLAFHFLRLYHFIFRRITHGASRLQEVMADRVAVHNYGAPAFSEGLKHVVRQSIVFGKVADKEISAALADRRKFNNLYELDAEGDPSDIETAFKEEFERPTNEDDTHPSGSDRVRLAAKFTGQTHPDIGGQLWALFVDREKFTGEMNIMIEQMVRGDRYSNYHDMGISQAGD